MVRRMSFEVEIKYRGVDHNDLERRLLALGARPAISVTQVDIYLAHPSRDFAETNEAFRIRRDLAGNRLTYKGPKRVGPTKTREEIEIAFDPGPTAYDAMQSLCAALGFRLVANVMKARRPYHLTYQGHSLEITLDLAIGLGTFAEVEALAEVEADLPDAQAAVLALAAELGLAEVEPRSYLRMHLEAVGP